MEFILFFYSEEVDYSLFKCKNVPFMQDKNTKQLFVTERVQ